MARVLITIPDEILKQLDETAKSQHRSRSEMVREAIRRQYYFTSRTPAEQVRVEEVTKRIDRIRKDWKEPFDSTKIVRQMRDRRRK